MTDAMVAIRRKVLLGIAGALAFPFNAFAQPRAQRICWLSGAASRSEAFQMAFVDQLHKLGFVEGKNLVIEFRSAEGRAERLPELAADLARQACDAFLSAGAESNLEAVKRVAKDKPIVMVAGDYDPVARGHIASLARPGGRITGVHPLQTSLAEKRIELLRELLPRAKRFGVLSDVATVDQLNASRVAAGRLGVELVVHEFKSAPYDFDAAFIALTGSKVDAVLTLASTFFVNARRRIPALALKHRLPSIFNNYLWTEAGGLMSYGTNLTDMFRRAADQMAKVLKGTRPADIPVEQPTVVELVINMKTAKALGISIPQGVWFRAERIIE